MVMYQIPFAKLKVRGLTIHFSQHRHWGKRAGSIQASGYGGAISGILHRPLGTGNEN